MYLTALIHIRPTVDYYGLLWQWIIVNSAGLFASFFTTFVRTLVVTISC